MELTFWEIISLTDAQVINQDAASQEPLTVTVARIIAISLEYFCN